MPADEDGPATFATPRIGLERRPDGVLRMWSEEPLAPTVASMAVHLRHGAQAHPDRVLVAERDGDEWRRTTWAEARERADRIAQGLLERGVGDRPVMVLSGNGTSHLLLTLAAYTLGVPVVPTSVAYALQSRDHAKLRELAALVEPGTVFADDPVAYAAALDAVGRDRLVLSDRPAEGVTSMADVLATDAGPEVDRRAAAVGPDHVAKILFTSGSTGAPKGVITTHGMLTTNQQQVRQAWPFLADEPPVLLDWLPWSHTFGGNHNLGLVLANGGSLWIDDGRPAPGLVERTVRNLGDVSPTLYFNVPAGYAALVPLLERDDLAAKAFLARLRLGFFAAAALPQQLWERLVTLAARHGAPMQMTTAWGLTETAPAATSAYFPIERSDCLGVPLARVELLLVPSGGKTEVRVRGPNVTPGYHKQPSLTAAAFDDEGYFRTGDAVELADPTDPARGLVFRGRLAEDFKLATGTFVSVGTLRPALLSYAKGKLADAVLCGHDGDYVAALTWPHPEVAGRVATDGTPDDELRAELVTALGALAAVGGGSSQRIERLLLLTTPPALDTGEITDKGYVNQRAVREQRAGAVARLLADPPDASVVVRG